MASIKQEAQNYEPPKTKNIADLESVSTDLQIVDKDYGEGENKFTVSVVTIDEEDYRVPISVLKSLKAILEIKPALEKFRVQKTGEGMKTEYTVIPLE